MRIGILAYLFQLIFVYFLWLTLIWFYKKHEKHLQWRNSTKMFAHFCLS